MCIFKPNYLLKSSIYCKGNLNQRSLDHCEWSIKGGLSIYKVPTTFSKTEIDTFSHGYCVKNVRLQQNKM